MSYTIKIYRAGGHFLELNRKSKALEVRQKIKDNKHALAKFSI